MVQYLLPQKTFKNLQENNIHTESQWGRCTTEKSQHTLLWSRKYKLVCDVSTNVSVFIIVFYRIYIQMKYPTLTCCLAFLCSLLCALFTLFSVSFISAWQLYRWLSWLMQFKGRNTCLSSYPLSLVLPAPAALHDRSYHFKYSLRDISEFPQRFERIFLLLRHSSKKQTLKSL